ncbi:unnamed protein product [Oppiella nova]|uniref:C2H2-type domain-containing protein n=1 Tax=Oppiella nova TaxID=334625 RepID=A0A7R9R0J4_9ACAR|nr:unnamed protein product [Oppiella nova]CAG2181068.1 unnamed protein product [Oppiella nova]
MISTFMCKFSGCDQKFEKVMDLKAHESQHRRDHNSIDFKRQPKTTLVTPSEATKSSDIPVVKTPEPRVPTPTPEVKFKCKHEGCSAEYKTRRSLAKHEEKPHLPSGDVDTIDANTGAKKCDQTAITASKDPQKQLELLQKFYAFQKEKTKTEL